MDEFLGKVEELAQELESEINVRAGSTMHYEAGLEAAIGELEVALAASREFHKEDES